MDRGAWQAIVHGVSKSQTRLKDSLSLSLSLSLSHTHTHTHTHTHRGALRQYSHLIPPCALDRNPGLGGLVPLH